MSDKRYLAALFAVTIVSSLSVAKGLAQSCAGKSSPAFIPPATRLDGTLLAQGQPFVRTFTIRANQSGGFSIKARVEPPGQDNNQPTPMQGQQALPLSIVDPLGAQSGQPPGQQAGQPPGQQAGQPPTPAGPPPATVQQVQDIFNGMAQQMQQQQQAIVNQLAAAQQAQANQLNQTITRLGQQQAQGMQAVGQQLAAQNRAAQAMGQQLQQQQNFMANAFMQFQQDQILRNFERQMLADPRLLGALGNNMGAFGRRDMLWLVRDMLRAATSMANRNQQPQNQQPFNYSQGGQSGQGGQLDPNARVAQQQMPTAEEIAYKLKELMGDKLSDDAAKKVLQALNESTQQAGASSSRAEIDRFAKLSDKLDGNLLASSATGSGSKDAFAFNPDDYEQLKRLADNVGDDNISQKEFLELALEAAGRVGSSQDTPESERQKARNFALQLSIQFHDLKNKVNTSGSADRTMLADIDYDIEKCLRISSGKDFYA